MEATSPQDRRNGEAPTPDELPELSAKQVELAIWAAQMALVDDGRTWRLYGNRDGELCTRPVHEGPAKRAD